MKKDITLIILAAGMGSRFGGLKQIEAMGPNGEFIIDYSVYDAIKAGFTKIVFLIKRENYNIFKETIGSRVEKHITVEYAFQEGNIPEDFFDLLKDREKPLGTAHAIMCCRDNINGPFAIINADDFYGFDAYKKAFDYLNTVDVNSTDYGMIAYLVKNTLTENGSAKRGICETCDGMLTTLTESKCERVGDKIIASPLSGDPSFEVDGDSVVSMNFLLFTPKLFEQLSVDFPKFLEKNRDNLEKCEYLIPDALENFLKRGESTVKVISTDASWYGVTYREDMPNVKKALLDFSNASVYPKKLWD